MNLSYWNFLWSNISFESQTVVQVRLQRFYTRKNLSWWWWWWSHNALYQEPSKFGMVRWGFHQNPIDISCRQASSYISFFVSGFVTAVIIIIIINTTQLISLLKKVKRHTDRETHKRKPFSPPNMYPKSQPLPSSPHHVPNALLPYQKTFTVPSLSKRVVSCVDP